MARYGVLSKLVFPLRFMPAGERGILCKRLITVVIVHE